jgi:hypothetical protein
MPPLLLALAGSLAPATAQTDNVGLSSVRAQRFVDEAVPPHVPHQGDLFSFAVAAGDFDGDGADDLATGIPRFECVEGAGASDCGAVVIRYGARGGGLEAGIPSQLLTQQESGSPNPAELDDFFGHALAACDFDGDGFDDLAVGVPGEDLALGGTVTIENSGIVEIYYGGDGGLAIPAAAVLSSNGIQSGNQALGSALACGRIGSDPFEDLVVGIPGGTVNDLSSAGRIRFYPGSEAGVGAGAIGLHQDSAGMHGVAESGDRFGEALVLLDFDGDDFLDLAIGVPGEDGSAGAVQIVEGEPAGLNPILNTVFFENALGGSPEGGDEFGRVLAAGDFDGDSRDDLAIGVPYKDVGSAEDTGVVAVVYGQPAVGPPLLRRQIFDQDALLGAGNSESDDRFGWALASGDFDRDGRGDLAIGHPLEDNSGASDGNADGSVTALLGGPAEGLSPARRRHFASGFAGIPGEPAEHGKGFGYSLTCGDFDGDGHGDLAIGIPYDDEEGLFDVGSEVVLYGSLFADGFEDGEISHWSDVEPQS